jgi:hypothetical protein
MAWAKLSFVLVKSLATESASPSSSGVCDLVLVTAQKLF